MECDYCDSPVDADTNKCTNPECGYDYTALVESGEYHNPN